MTCKTCDDRLERVLIEAEAAHESADKLNRKYLGVPDWMAEEDVYYIAGLPKSERGAAIEEMVLDIEDAGALEAPTVVRDDFYNLMLEAEVV